MAKHLLISPDGEKAILEIGWEPETCSIKFKLRILDPDDQSWMDFPAEEMIRVDEKISKEILKIALNHKKKEEP